MGYPLLYLTQFAQYVHSENLLSEVPVVQFSAQDDLIELLQLFDSELLRK